MKLPTVNKIKTSLKEYFTYSKTSDIVVVSLDKTELPFAYIIEDSGYPNNLLISFAVNFPIANVVADLVLKVNKIKNVLVTENFYISNSGHTLWGQEAVERFHIDNFVDLETLEAVSEELN